MIRTKICGLLSLAAQLPDAHVQFDTLSVTIGWRVFAPDPATSEFLRVTAADGSPVDYMPLVCRLNDQLLLIAIAPPSMSAITIHKNSRRPLVRDLFTESIDTDAPLHPIGGESWGNVGLFLIEP